MKGKKEFIILAAIIIAVAAYLVLRQTDREQYQLPQMATLEKKDLSKIEIIRNGKTVTLIRKDDKWRIPPEDYPVDTGKIDQILDTISGLKLTAMVSESKNDVRYDLGSEKRIQVKAWSGENLKRDFQMGKAANTFRHTFVKIAGDDRVFHAENNFRDRFEVTIDELRDKTVMAFNSKKIKMFSITKDGRTTEFKKKEIATQAKETKNKDEQAATRSSQNQFQWITTDNKPADSKKIESFLSALSNLKCQTFLNDRQKTDFKHPVISITLSGAKTYQLSIYAREKKEGDESLWPAQSSENRYPFLLADWKAKSIIKNPLDLMPGKPESEKAANTD